MSATRRRLMIAFALICVCGFAALVISNYYSGPQIDEEAADKIHSLAYFFGDHLGMYRVPENPLPLDYAATDDPSCMNSWRLTSAELRTGFPDPSDGSEPDFTKCWRSNTYDRFDEIWRNSFCLSCKKNKPRSEHYTEIMTIVGPNTPYTEYVDGSRIKTIKDFPNDSLLLLEVPDSKTHWMQAGDMPLSALEEAAEKKEPFGTGVSSHGRWVAFADGTTWLMDKATPVAVLLPFCTVEGAKKHDRENALKKYKLYNYDPHGRHP